jgi:O-antigen/teichoic acid export membrane protein
MSIIRNSSVSLATKAVETFLNLALLAILARLLDPKDFGVFAIILATQALFQPLIDMGLGAAYIKAKEPTKDLRNSFFTLNLALGVFNVAILIIAAPLITHIYADELLLPLILTFSISVLLNSVSRQSYAQLMRDKRFDSLLKVSFFANIVTFFVSVYFAFQGVGVWVLIIKAIMLSLVSTILLFYFTRTGYNLVMFSTIKRFTKELKFGLEVFLNRLLNGIFNAGDKFIFSTLYGVELLGHYSSSQQLARMADTHIRMPISAAVYSHLERLENDNKRKLYDDFASVIFLLASLFVGTLILEGELVVHIILGDKWGFAGEYIKWLAIFGMGMVFKGIFTIISMSENSMVRQNKIVLASILILMISGFFVYLNEYGAMVFIRIISCSFFIFWLYFLAKEVKRKSVNPRFVSIVILMMLFIGLLVFFQNKMSFQYNRWLVFSSFLAINAGVLLALKKKVLN